VLGYLFGRHHHPALWLGLTGALALATAAAVTLWPFMLAALVIVTGARAHGRGWSLGRYTLTAASWLGALILVIVGAALAGLGGALVALALAWGIWHVLARPRAHSLTRKVAE
jgi:hypothetical protein